MAILKAVLHWRLILLGRKYTILTDQRSISTIFDCFKTSKIKADRMIKWKILLGEFSYDIQYRPGTSNLGADGFSRLTHQGTKGKKNRKMGLGLSSTDKMKNTSVLSQLHRSMGHPGVIRLWHLVKDRNLAYDFSDVESICESRQVRSKIKPKYFKAEPLC